MNTIQFACVSRCEMIALACILAIGSMRTADAATYSQIESPFAVHFPFPIPNNNVYGLSQSDTSGGGFDNFANVYDNFSFATDMSVTNFSWIGIYELDPGAIDPLDQGPLADSFTVNIYSDAAGQPGGLVRSVSEVSANETALSDGIYSYSLDIAPLGVIGGTDYWFSAVANLDASLADGNTWGVAYSPLGDGTSYSDIETFEGSGVFDSQFETANLAFSVSAVPEPATGIALLVLGGAAAYRRRLQNRKAAV
ncbi:PEP-CTERM sorting domain-containing protein [Neorhodopirellula lusitana]|uniref:PEP-CTERM sorting domain-containing protein n=1 Tax=Neorhodopirellula lusitana TaxID=445327 RepID=UPI00384E811E